MDADDDDDDDGSKIRIGTRKESVFFVGFR